jgi:hypothetical protein
MSTIQLPPEERFWQRYSPHFELPVSVCSSAFLHSLAFGILALGGLFLGLLGLNQEHRDPAIDIVQMEGARGTPDGAPVGPRVGLPPMGDEQGIAEPADKRDPRNLPNEELKAVPPKPLDLQQELNDKSNRRIEEPKASEHFARIRGRMHGTPDRPAQKGDANAKGNKGTGSGGPGTLDARRRARQQRWVMIFNTQSGEDYLNQLAGLGAILAIPNGSDGFLVIRDLKRRPVQPRPEDIGQINRMSWNDDKPESVRSLALALGLRSVPEYIKAFFPTALEEELLQKELKAFRGKEEDIEETTFVIEKRDGRYVPRVQSQERKK